MARDVAEKTLVLKIPIELYFNEIIIQNRKDYYGALPVDFSTSLVYKCPLHDEKMSSMRFYPETNSFNCFGCRKGGNIINLHYYFMKHFFGVEISKDDAIRFLYKYFISGKSFALDELLQQKPRLSNNIEILRFERRVHDIEQRCFKYDSNYKGQVYNMLDVYVRIVAADTANATDAKRELEQNLCKLKMNF